jgi:hypothetical protein
MGIRKRTDLRKFVSAGSDAHCGKRCILSMYAMPLGKRIIASISMGRMRAMSYGRLSHEECPGQAVDEAGGGARRPSRQARGKITVE